MRFGKCNPFRLFPDPCEIHVTPSRLRICVFLQISTVSVKFRCNFDFISFASTNSIECSILQKKRIPGERVTCSFRFMRVANVSKTSENRSYRAEFQKYDREEKRAGREVHKYAGRRSRSETSFYSHLSGPPAAVLKRLIRFYGPPRESYDRNCINLSFSCELETSSGRKKSFRCEDLKSLLRFYFLSSLDSYISPLNRKVYYVIHMFCLCL